jgi:uncharacterized surface protein with fasciclin (FAS1) repeats
MKKRMTVALLCLAAVAAVAAGCGNDNNDTSSAAPPTMATTAPQAASPNIVALAKDTPDLSTLVAAVTAGDLATTLQGKGPFTVFAPTNQGFSDIKSTVDTLLKPENKADLKNVLTYHVVPGTFTAADLKDGQKLTTVEGQKLTVSVDGNMVKVNGATVEKADVNASNGVVHVINKVLVPPAA